nr:bifunctional inhibitor/plant lipid transfer protein/seed storage helical domain-containing protein [Tanacetum cinerariifolium]
MEYSLRFFMVALMALLLSTGHTQLAEAQARCDPVQLSWCLQAFVSDIPPTQDCCRRFKGEEGCLCSELLDPTFGAYLRLPGARRCADEWMVVDDVCGRR